MRSNILTAAILSLNCIVAWGQWKMINKRVYHFSKNAAKTPNVHCSGIVLAAKENLGGSIPQGYHLRTNKTKILTFKHHKFDLLYTILELMPSLAHIKPTPFCISR